MQRDRTGRCGEGVEVDERDALLVVEGGVLIALVVEAIDESLLPFAVDFTDGIDVPVFLHDGIDEVVVGKVVGRRDDSPGVAEGSVGGAHVGEPRQGGVGVVAASLGRADDDDLVARPDGNAGGDVAVVAVTAANAGEVDECLFVGPEAGV